MHLLLPKTDSGCCRPFLRDPLQRMLAHVLILCTVVILQLIELPTVAAGEFDRPNVILCMADDQGLGDVGYVAGGLPVKTPVLDQMAAGGLRFDAFYAACPVCSPTRGSVLTGRHPNRFGCFTWGGTLRPQEVTLAEALKKAGYATGHFGKWHLGPVRADNPVCPGKSGFDRWVSSPNFYENDPLMSDEGKVVQLQGESSRVTVDAALPFMKQAVDDKKPFFAVIWFGNPHTPHKPTSELSELYADKPALKNYLGELTGIDRAMGHLRTELKAMGARDNTLLWYTSDNGAAAPGSTAGLRGRKGTVYEGGLRVPGIIEWPAVIQQPRATNVRSSTVDIFPTILDIAGIKNATTHPLDGVSLKPILTGKDFARPRPLAFWSYPAAGHRTPSAEFLRKMQVEETGDQIAGPNAKWECQPWTKPLDSSDRKGHAAWVDGDYKLHRISGKNGGVKYLLYNLATDPQEKRNLSDSESDRLSNMQQALETWQASVIKSVNGGDYR